MYIANTGQLHKENPNGEPYKNWVLFIRLDAGTKVEEIIREKHERISTLLREQNVSYAEITTEKGKDKLYKKFELQNKSFPFFLVFSKFPKFYQKGDYLLLIEWGKWRKRDYDILKEDVVKFARFFSDEKLKNELANAGNKRAWKKVLKLIIKYGPDFIKTCATIIPAVL